MFCVLFFLFFLSIGESCFCVEGQEVFLEKTPSITLKRSREDDLKQERKYKKRLISEKDEIEILSPKQPLPLPCVESLEHINEYFEKVCNVSLSRESSRILLYLLYGLEKSIKDDLKEEHLIGLATDDQIKYKTNKVQWIFDKWPHQTWVEAAMGELFYPHELRKLDDSPCDLYERSTVRYRLALSASYKNPLAYHHLASLMANYFSKDKEDKLVHTQAKLLSSLFSRKSKSYFSKGMKEGNHYIKAISNWYLSAPESRKLIQEAIDNQGEYRLLSYISVNHNQEELRLYYRKALEHGYTDALVKLADVAKSAAESVLWSLKAAIEENIASGYYKAALKLDGQGCKTIKDQMSQIENPDILCFNRDFTQNDIMAYLDKSGNMGMVVSFREKARILSDIDKDSQDAVETYMKAAETLGDEYSCYRLGLIYANKGHKEQADDCFQKAGIRGYFFYLKDHASGEIKQQALINILEHLQEINNLSNGKRL